MTAFTLCAVGFRGAATVEALVASNVIPARLISYPQKGDPSRAFEQIKLIGLRYVFRSCVQQLRLSLTMSG
ncbi:hypothetical protein BAL199_14637 [alpha proteobacterium BAL199]|nr:hypothetical protein BAL199_14637 [alpha proteobacterium BAL199]